MSFSKKFSKKLTTFYLDVRIAHAIVTWWFFTIISYTIWYYTDALFVRIDQQTIGNGERSIHALQVFDSSLGTAPVSTPLLPVRGHAERDAQIPRCSVVAIVTDHLDTLQPFFLSFLRKRHVHVAHRSKI